MLTSEDVLGREQPTPFFVYDLDVVDAIADYLEARVQALTPPGQVLYAVKANRSPGLLRHLARRGWGFDVACWTEFQHVRAAGIDPGRCSCLGPGWTVEELCVALSLGARVDVDNGDQLMGLSRRAHVGTVGLRLRIPAYGDAPGRASRFGVDPEDPGVWDSLARLEVERLHVHLGEMTSPDLVGEVVAACCRLAGRLPSVTELNLGGGMDELARSGGLERLWPTLSEASDRAEKQLGRRLRMTIEPGSLLVSRAGWLVGTVLAASSHADLGRLVGLDCSAWNLLGWDKPEAHHASGPGSVRHSVVGNTCYEQDVFAEGVGWGSAAQVGDRVACRGVGAYTSSMARSLHGLPPPQGWIHAGGSWARDEGKGTTG